MRINVLTPGFTTSNGAAFLFPLVVHKRQLQDAGIDVRFVKRDSIEIAAAGQERYIEFTSGPQAGKLFVSHLRDILSA